MFGRPEHHGRERGTTHSVLQRRVDELGRIHGQCRGRRLGVRRPDLFECERILFDLLEVFHGTAIFRMFLTMHQILMTGRTRTDAGCTEEAPP